MALISELWDFVSTKDWNIYPFISPLFSLFVSLYIVPVYSDLYGKNLLSYLESQDMEEKYEIINAVGKDRSLQIAYLTGVPSFFSSVIATLKSDHPILLTTILVILLLPGLVLFLKVFLRPPGYNATTRFPEKAKPEFIYKREWTYVSVYSKVLAVLNLVFIILIIIALPNKKP